jgi:hypothetical protein
MMRNRILIAAIALILIGVSVWYFLPGKITVENQGNGKYGILLPKGGWQDTGIWVSPQQIANICTLKNHQPFTVKLGNKDFTPRIIPGGNFCVDVDTGNTGTQKIFLKLSSESTEDEIPLGVSVK